MLTPCFRLQQKTGASHEEEKEPTCTKIYYASRTHSQLTQVLHELHKLKLRLNVSVASTSTATVGVGSKRPSSDISGEESFELEGEGARAISLGSRKQLCINEHLRKKAGDLDEACRQMLGGMLCVHWPVLSMLNPHQRRESLVVHIFLR